MVFLLPHIAHHHPDHVTFLHPEILSSLFLSSNFALTFLTSSIPWLITFPLPTMVILSAKSPCCTFFFLASELYLSHLLSQGNYSLYSVYPSNDIVRCFAFSHPSSQPHHHLAKDVEERVRGMGRYVLCGSAFPETPIWNPALILYMVLSGGSFCVHNTSFPAVVLEDHPKGRFFIFQFVKLC